VKVPSDYALGMFNQASGLLEFPATVFEAQGTLHGTLKITIDVGSNTAIIHGFNPIEPGWLAFKLGFVKPGSGTHGTFYISTTDVDGALFDDSRYGDEAGPATSLVGIAPTFGSLGSVVLDLPTAGRADPFLVKMVSVGEVESSGKIMLTLPQGYDLTNAKAILPTGRLWLATSLQVQVNQTGVSCSTNSTCGGGILMIHGFKTIATGELSFTLTGVRSAAQGVQSLNVETGDSLGFVIDRLLNIKMSPPAGYLRSVAVSIPGAGVEGDVSIAMTAFGQVPPDGSILINFPTKSLSGHPSKFVVGDSTIYAVTGLTPQDVTQGLTVTHAGQQVRITGFTKIAEMSRISFVIRNIRSPASWSSGLFDIRTVNAFDAAFDVAPPNVTLVPKQGALYSVELSLPAAGKSGPLNVSFATTGTVLHAGKIKVPLLLNPQASKS
jgi:hypothetical protein